jgi:lipoate-protein ligase A
MIASKLKISPNPMFRDLCLLEFAEEYLNPDEFIFFFYTWDKPSVSLGRSQRKSQDLIQECILKDIPVTIRPSGGKAVIHDGDICFTFIARQSHKHFGGNLQKSYSKVLDYILKILNEYFTQSLGWEGNIEAKIQASKQKQKTSSEDNVTEHAQNRASKTSDQGIANTSKLINIYNQNCFSQALGSEGIIKYQGDSYKVLGSAQMMYASCFLQQGSILINNKNPRSKLSFDIPSMSMTEVFKSGGNLNLDSLTKALNEKTQNSFNA